MFHRQSNTPNPRTGVTPPIFIPRSEPPTPIQPGDYFLIKIHDAQAAFRGSIFTNVRQLVITTKVDLDHPDLDAKNIAAIQRTREVRPDSAVKLGLSPNLVSLVPAVPRVSVSVAFLKDQENNLAKLVPLINSDSFMSVISLAPGAVAAAKAIGGLAEKMIQAYLPAQQQQPILQFDGDFDIAEAASGETLRDGYYVILGSSNPADQLPDPSAKLAVGPTDLTVDGQAVTQLSYIVLEVTRVPARTRKLSAGTLWDKKLYEAESLAQEAVDDPTADDDAKRNAWAKCKTVLQDAKTLLLTDTNYTPTEAASIYKTVYKGCADALVGGAGHKSSKAKALGIDTQADRAGLGIGLDEDLEQTTASYRQREREAEPILAANQYL